MREIKIINSANVEQKYAGTVVESKTKEAEKNGWHKFGEPTAVYNKETNEYILIQVLQK